MLLKWHQWNQPTRQKRKLPSLDFLHIRALSGLFLSTLTCKTHTHTNTKKKNAPRSQSVLSPTSREAAPVCKDDQWKLLFVEISNRLSCFVGGVWVPHLTSLGEELNKQQQQQQQQQVNYSSPRVNNYKVNTLSDQFLR